MKIEILVNVLSGCEICGWVFKGCLFYPLVANIADKARNCRHVRTLGNGFDFSKIYMGLTELH